MDEKMIKNDISCERCERKFATESSLQFHISRSHDFECHLCYTLFRVKFFYERHYKEIHASDEDMVARKIEDAELVFSCKVCGKRFAKEKFLNYHSKTRNHKQIETDEALEIHKKRKIAAKERTFSCLLCYHSFDKKWKMRNHQEQIHKDDMDLLEMKFEAKDLKFTCETCGKKFVKDHILEYHIDLNHPEEVKNFCKTCFAPVNAMNKMAHRRIIHKDIPGSIKEPNYACNICDKKFATENCSLYHRIIGHMKGKLKSCKLCLENFSDNDTLRTHFENFHGSQIDELKAYLGEVSDMTLNFQCKRKGCGKSFYSEHILKHHMRFHPESKVRNDTVKNFMEIFKTLEKNVNSK